MSSPVRSVAVRLSMDPSSYIAGATRAERSTLALDKAVSQVGPHTGTSMEKAAAGAGKAEGAFGKAQKSAGALGFTLGGLAGAGAAVAVGMSVKWAGDYQSALTRLNTTAGESTKNLGMVGRGMLDMAGQVGIGADELAKGMYTIDSAGIHGADSLIVLKAAAQGARQEQADLGHVVDAVTTSLHDYHLPASDAAKVTSQLIAAVSSGKTTFDELTGAMHSVEPIAASAGMSIAQTAGALAAMTASGMHADQAAQNLASSIRSFEKPTGTMRDELYQLGLDANDLSAHLGQRGIAGTLQMVSDAIVHKMGPAGQVALDSLNKNKAAAQDLVIMMKSMTPEVAKLSNGLLTGSVSVSEYSKAAKGLGGQNAAMALQFLSLYKSSAGFSQILKTGGPAVQTYIGALGKAVGTAEGLSVALQLTGENATGANKAIHAVATAAAQADGSIRGWDEVQHNFNQRLAEAEAGAKSLAIEAGQHLLPILTNGLGWIHDNGPAALHTLGTGFDEAASAAKPLIDAAGGAYHVFRELPAPIQEVVIGLAALKVATSLDLFSGITGKVSAFAQTARLQMALADESISSGRAAAAGLAAGFEATMPRASAAVASMAMSTKLAMAEVSSSFAQAKALQQFNVAEQFGGTAVSKATGDLAGLGAAAGTAAKTGLGALRSGASGLIGLLGGSWVVGIGAAAGALMYFRGQIEQHDAQVEADTASVKSWYEAMATKGGAAAADGMNNIRSKTLELANAQAKLNDLQAHNVYISGRGGAQLGLSNVAIARQAQVVADLTKETTAGKKQWDDYWNSLTPQGQATATVAADEATLAYQIQQHGVASVQVKNATADYNAALDKQKTLAGQVAAAEQTQIDKLNQLASVQLGSVSSALAATQAQSQLADAIAQYNKDSRDGQHSTKQLADESNSLAQQAISTAQAIGKQVTDQMAANGTTDDGTMANKAMLASLQEQAKHITGPGHAALEQAIAYLLQTTVASGNLQDASKKMGLDVVKTWDKNTEVIKGATDQQIKDLQALGLKVTTLPDGNIMVNTDTHMARDGLNALINDYANKVLRIDTSAGQHISSATGPGGTSLKYATGGLLRGPGTGTSDSIPIMGSNGEFMVKASATAKHLPLLHAINNDQIPGYAAGGPVGHFSMHKTMPADLSAQAVAQAHAAIAQMAAQAAAMGMPGGAPSSVSGNAAIVQRVAGQYGWGSGSGSEWDALYRVIMRESGFRNTAQNPTSTAYGMFQFLNSTWGAYGTSKTSDPLFQAVAGLRYIKERYSDPLGAYRHEQSYGWYHNGGTVQGTPGADVPAILQAGETVRTTGQEAVLQKVLRSRERAGIGTDGSHTGGVPQVTVNARVFVGDREITDIARVEAETVLVDYATAQSHRGRYNP